MSKIKCAAILKDGIPHTGKRHSDIIRSAAAKNYPQDFFKNCEQGFMTEDGYFADRAEAADIAFREGQIKRRVGELCSEDLY